MANWYGIDGIEFHFRGTNRDPEITMDGITDSICVDAENAMLAIFKEEHPDKPDEFFNQYMLEDAEGVKDLIREMRA